MRFLTVISVLAVLGAGCATTPDSEVDRLSFAITDGSSEAIGVLDMLNDPSTDIDVLDFDAKLNARSARNLVHYRDGFDGVFGTYDDNLFGDIEEVDSVRWVGPAALAQLVSYAATAGWIPQGEDILGTWDGVTFTVDEAGDTLDYVNDADHSTLDFDLGLDRRAANSIVAAQPIATIEDLAGLYYVGSSALTLLKGAACAPAPTQGFSDQFNHDEELDIPDATASGIDSEVHVHGVPAIDVEITFLVDFLHDAPAELEVELTAPTGQVWTLTNGASSVNTVLNYTADPEGVWTLNVADTVAGNQGAVWGWALEVVNSP